jgi:hypothetical protein
MFNAWTVLVLFELLLSKLDAWLQQTGRNARISTTCNWKYWQTKQARTYSMNKNQIFHTLRLRSTAKLKRYVVHTMDFWRSVVSSQIKLTKVEDGSAYTSLVFDTNKEIKRVFAEHFIVDIACAHRMWCVVTGM